MGLLFIIVVGIVLGLTIFKRLDNSPKPKRVFFWHWTSQEKIDEIVEKERRKQGW
jgi:hypothetical protein